MWVKWTLEWVWLGQGPRGKARKSLAKPGEVHDGDRRLLLIWIRAGVLRKDKEVPFPHVIGRLDVGETATLTAELYRKS